MLTLPIILYAKNPTILVGDILWMPNPFMHTLLTRLGHHEPP